MFASRQWKQLLKNCWYQGNEFDSLRRVKMNWLIPMKVSIKKMDLIVSKNEIGASVQNLGHPPSIYIHVHKTKKKLELSNTGCTRKTYIYISHYDHTNIQMSLWWWAHHLFCKFVCLLPNRWCLARILWYHTVGSPPCKNGCDYINKCRTGIYEMKNK